MDGQSRALELLLSGMSPEEIRGRIEKAHDVSGEARDADGKWTAGGGKSPAREAKKPVVPKTLEATVDFVMGQENRADGLRPFVRWSHGPKGDAKIGYNSFNSATGQSEGGLSVNGLMPADYMWANTPKQDAVREYIAQQLTEYEFVSMGGAKPYLVLGRESHRGGDNEPIIQDVEYIGEIPKQVIEEAHAALKEKKQHEEVLRDKYSMFGGKKYSREQQEQSEAWAKERRLRRRREEEQETA